MYALVYMLDYSAIPDVTADFEGDPAAWAENEISEILLRHGGDWWHGRFFVFSGEDALAVVYQNVERLRALDWFVNALESIEIFTISHSSDVGPLFGLTSKHRGP